MKKLIAVLFLAFAMIFVSEIYSQPKQKKVDVYFGKNDGKNVILDENYTFIDSNYVWTGRIESIESLVKKYIGKNRDNDYFFTEKEKWQKDFTGLKLGEEFYISTPSAILKGEISAYKLWNNEPMGYEFSPVLKLQTKINEDTVEYNNNIFICSKYKNMSTILNKPIEDAEVIKKVTAFLDEYTKNIVIDPEMGVDDPAEIKVFQANFLNTDRNEYAVSYRKRIGFEKFASGIYIINDIGKIAKTVVEFASEFNYYCLVGVVDYNGDGQYELFGESGYYEGSGYDLYKINSDGNFELIASGFYWGV